MKAEELIKNYTHFITDQNNNKWEVIEVSDLPDILDAELKEAKELAEKLMYRMDRCRDILQSKPNAGNWGILDTKLDRIKFNKQDKKEKT